jgi:hypothetical protein
MTFSVFYVFPFCWATQQRSWNTKHWNPDFTSVATMRCHVTCHGKTLLTLPSPQESRKAVRLEAVLGAVLVVKCLRSDLEVDFGDEAWNQLYIASIPIKSATMAPTNKISLACVLLLHFGSEYRKISLIGLALLPLVRAYEPNPSTLENVSCEGETCNWEEVDNQRVRLLPSWHLRPHLWRYFGHIDKRSYKKSLHIIDST